MATGEVTGRGLQGLLDEAGDLLGLGQAPGTGIRTREAPDRRLDHLHAPAAQGGDIGPRGGVLPHLGVHGRSHEHGSTGREQ